MSPKSIRQDLMLRDHAYRLIVQRPESADARWEATGLKDARATFGPKTFASEAEAKKSIHLWAYVDADATHPATCDGNCKPWIEG